MNNFWGPRLIKNPNLENDLRTYFFQDCNDESIKNIIKQYKQEVEIICDRFEFINHLLKLNEIFIEKRTYSSTTFSKVSNNKPILEISRNENIIWSGIELNGINYDIEALCQYLLLTIIDTIMGGIKYINFTTWLKNHNINQNKYSLCDLDALQKKYDEEHGLRRNFIKAFSDHLSEKIRNRIIKTFIVSKIDQGNIKSSDYSEWQEKSDDKKYICIVKYLYDRIRCRYTHSCSRTLLSDCPINIMMSTKEKVLISTVAPKDDNLIKILMDVIRELMIEKYVNKNIYHPLQPDIAFTAMQVKRQLG